MSTGFRGAATIAAGAAVVAWLVACFEVSGPPGGILAISALRPAWPSVVEGDVLRDNNGAEAPLTIEVYDGRAEPVTDATVTFIPLDRGLSISSDGVVHGDSVRTSPVRVVAQVRRAGDVLQTPESTTIDVVPRPDSVSPAGFDTLDVKTYTLSGSTDTAQVTSEPLTVTLRNRARLASNTEPTGVRKWIVLYEITDAPDGVPNAVTAFFSGTATQAAAVDTTDSDGKADQRVVLRTSVLTGSRTGTHLVKVTVTIRERGQNVPGSPVQIVVPFEIRPAS